MPERIHIVKCFEGAISLFQMDYITKGNPQELNIKSSKGIHNKK